jgi:hypothetical protein
LAVRNGRWQQGNHPERPIRQGAWSLGQNKTRRIYRELGLQLRNRTPKRRVKAKLREDRRAATRPHETRAMNFVHDQLATGRKLRVLTRPHGAIGQKPPIMLLTHGSATSPPS